MGDQCVGEVLDLQELIENSDLIRELYRKSLEGIFGRSVSGNESSIGTIGREVELYFVNQNGQPISAFDQIQQIAGEENISPETLNYHGEVKDKHDTFFTLGSSLDQVVEGMHKIIFPVYDATQQLRPGLQVDIALMGGHPSFNRKLGGIAMSDKKRYATLRKLSKPLAKTVTIEYNNGDSETLHGWGLEGFTSIQPNTKVPLKKAGYFFDAANMLGPLFVAKTASSPIFDNRITKYDSVRTKILPASNHGHHDPNRPGRWRVPESLTGSDFPEHFDRKVYEMFVKYNLEHLGRYFGSIAADRHLVVTREDLENGGKNFPKPTVWPWVQLHTSYLDEDGILLENRYREPLKTVEENASCDLTYTAMLEGLANQLYQGKASPLSAKQNRANLMEARSDKPTLEKMFYWTNGNGVKKAGLQAISYQNGILAATALQNSGHSDHDIKNILDPLLTKGGVSYQSNNSFAYLEQAEANPAQYMRGRAFALQPKSFSGERLDPGVVAAIVEDFRYRGPPAEISQVRAIAHRMDVAV